MARVSPLRVANSLPDSCTGGVSCTWQRFLSDASSHRNFYLFTIFYYWQFGRFHLKTLIHLLERANVHLVSLCEAQLLLWGKICLAPSETKNIFAKENGGGTTLRWWWGCQPKPSRSWRRRWSVCEKPPDKPRTQPPSYSLTLTCLKQVCPVCVYVMAWLCTSTGN